MDFRFMQETDVLQNLDVLFNVDRMPMLIISQSLSDVEFLKENVRNWVSVPSDVVLEIEEYASGFHEGHKKIVDTWFRSEDPKRIKILIATVAFGLGVDLPHIRSVLVWGAPRTVAALIQAFGRAGRDPARVERAYCSLVVTPYSLSNAEENMRVLVGRPRKKASGESKADKKPRGGQDVVTSVQCDLCDKWRKLPAGMAKPGEGEGFDCSVLGLDCPGLGCLKSCRCVRKIFELISTRSSEPIDGPAGDSEGCGDRCDFCRPPVPLQVPSVGANVIVLSRSSAFYGRCGKVVSVYNETKLEIDFGAQNSSVKGIEVYVVKEVKNPVPIPEKVQAPAHLNDRDILADSLDMAARTCGSRLPLSVLMPPATRALLVKHRPTTLDQLNLLDRLILHSCMREHVVEVIARHQTETARQKKPKTSNQGKKKKRAAGENPSTVQATQAVVTRSGRKTVPKSWLDDE